MCSFFVLLVTECLPVVVRLLPFSCLHRNEKHGSPGTGGAGALDC